MRKRFLTVCAVAFLVMAPMSAVQLAHEPPCLQDLTYPEGGPFNNFVAGTDELLEALWIVEEAGWEIVNTELCWDRLQNRWGHLVVYQMPAQ